MKKVKWIIYSLGIIAMSLFGCADDSSCQNGEVPTLDLSDLGCTNTPFTVSVQTLNEFELIRNQDDYDLHIDSKCTPDIDWTSYDLVAGMVGLSSGLAAIDKRLIMNCNTNRLVLTFDITLNLTTVAPHVSYNALIPKLKDDQEFFVEVNIIN